MWHYEAILGNICTQNIRIFVDFFGSLIFIWHLKNFIRKLHLTGPAIEGNARGNGGQYIVAVCAVVLHIEDRPP